MPTPADRQFFEALNKDLASSLGKAVKSAFDEQGKAKAASSDKVGLTSATIKELATLISTGVGKEVKKHAPDGKDKEDKPKKESADNRSWSKFTKSLGVFIVQNKLAAAAANTIKQTLTYGDIVSRASVATQNKQVLGTSLLSRKFEEFGVALPEIGEVFKAAMKAGAGPLTSAQANLFASTKLFDANMSTMIEFEARGVKAMGLSTAQSKELGTDMLHLARANGIYADVLLEAAVAMETTVRNLGLSHGTNPALSEAFLATGSKLQAGTAGMFKEDITSLLGKIAQIDMDDTIKMQALIGQTGSNVDLNKLQTDPQAYIGEMFALIGKTASDLATGKGGDKVVRKEFLEGIVGLSKNELSAAMALWKDIGTAGIMSLVQAPLPTESEKATIESAMADDQLSASNKLRKDQLKNAIAVAALTDAFVLARKTFEVQKSALGGEGRDAALVTSKWAGIVSIVGGYVKEIGLTVLGIEGIKKLLPSRGVKGPKPRARGANGRFIKSVSPWIPKKLRGVLKVGAMAAAALGVGSLASGAESDNEDPATAAVKQQAAATSSATATNPLSTADNSVDPRQFAVQGLELGMHGAVLRKFLATAGTKTLSKKIPILGTVAGVIMGISRALDGDFTGAAGELASGLASNFVGPGTALSLAIDAGLLARDYKALKTGKDLGSASNQASDVATMAISQLPMGGTLQAGYAGLNAQSMALTDKTVLEYLRSIVQNTGPDGLLGVTGDQRATADRQLEEAKQLRAESNVQHDLVAAPPGTSDFRLSTVFGPWGGEEAAVDNGN